MGINPQFRVKNKRRIEEDLFHRIEAEVDRIFVGWRPKITEESIY